ncbi:hypothetical protein AB28_1803 [Raoultella ornithinolytica 2-156-04_S1_C2]|nr:hypothetical protein AB00_2881 [Raoultella ornithinolytica 2-156-04_S1_C1]KDX15698.1 hypothetical protein AB28_1803 [Raoultella ornithinolytica 2-156-04_S1_C2]
MVTIYVKSCKEQHVLCRLRASVFDVIPARKIKKRRRKWRRGGEANG